MLKNANSAFFFFNTDDNLVSKLAVQSSSTHPEVLDVLLFLLQANDPYLQEALCLIWSTSCLDSS